MKTYLLSLLIIGAAIGLSLLVVLSVSLIVQRSRQPAEADLLVARPKPDRPLVAGLAKSRREIVGKLVSLITSDRLSEEDWEEVTEALIRADVGADNSVRIVDATKQAAPAPADMLRVLAEQLASVLSNKSRELRFNESGVSVWLVSGVNGVGKTTSIAKMAFWLRGMGKGVVLAAADTFRAAAADQLASWAQRVGVHIVRQLPGADPGAVVFDAIAFAKARGIDVVIVDTAGRLHTKSNLMDELRKIKKVADSEAGGVTESLLVLDATVGQNGLAQARTFAAAIELSGIVLAKLDGTAKGGIVVAIEETLGIPVKLIGLGESEADLEPFDPPSFAQALLS